MKRDQVIDSDLRDVGDVERRDYTRGIKYLFYRGVKELPTSVNDTKNVTSSEGSLRSICYVDNS